MWQLAYLTDAPSQQDLGADGHPAAHTAPLPPEWAARRMFAGGSSHCVRPLQIGQQATRTTRVVDAAERNGRAGRMQFVTVMHTYEQCGVEVLRDQHQIVYLSNSSVARSDDRVARVEEVELTGRERRVELDPVFLFRFSALSFNAHRIHYDRAFAVEVEGYPGLVVHGPLQALLMAELAREVAPATEGYRFEYRLVSPLFEDQGLVVGATESEDNVETYVRDATGRTTATGRWWACTTSA